VSLFRFRNICASAAFGLIVSNASAQMPDRPGRDETAKICSQCHELARSLSLRQDRDGWSATINKMIGLSAQGSQKEFALVLDYLSTNFPGEAIPKLNVNKATAIEFESALSLRRSQSAAVIEYRAKHGPLKSIADLERVPGIDVAKIEAKKDRLSF
jgi:competence protein ComEA